MAPADDSEEPSGPAAQQLLRVWLSPSFPVGAFAYSHGLETAVARGLVTSRADLEGWLSALLERGSVRNDLVLLGAAWRSTLDRGGAELAEINALALALQPSAERYLETAQQGGSFVDAVAAAWPCAGVAALRSQNTGDVAYPLAVGVAAAGHGVPLGEVLQAYGLAFVQNMTSAAIRLSVIGQTDAQRVIAASMGAVDTAALFAATANLDDLGGACFSADLASLEHETQQTRLFRS